MRPFAALERFLERLFERPAARLLGARLEPVTLVRRLERAIDQQRRVGPDGLVAPTRFAVAVSPADAAGSDALGALEDELAAAALAHARRRGYQIPERPTVAVVLDPGLAGGEARITALFADRKQPGPGIGAVPAERTLVHPLPAVAQPRASLRVVAPDGAAVEVPLAGQPVTIGRGADADVRLADPLVSRRHARLGVRGGRFVLADLGSTNGTRVNGDSIREAVVGPGDRIELGSTRLEIVLLAAREAR
jgi:hypothetical protein